MRVLSLFSGIGGLDAGFEKAGFNIVWANDFDKYAVKTYAANYEHEIVFGDINEIALDALPVFDVLIGGFPCQPFSMMGSELGLSDGYLLYPMYRLEEEEPLYPQLSQTVSVDGISHTVTIHLVRLPFVFEEDTEQTKQMLTMSIQRIFQ